MSAPRLTVEQLVVELNGRRLVDGVSLALYSGQMLGLVGESGSGKTMTARAVVGLPPEGATVKVGVCEVDSRPLRVGPHGVVMVTQDAATSLNPVRTIGSQIAEGVLLARRCTEGEANRRAVELLAEVGIAEPAVRAKQYAHQLSGGMRQRALFAAALACEPTVLLADEPTTGLDAAVQLQVLALLQRLATERGLAVLLITHELSVVAEVCEQVLVMHRGRIAEAGPTATVFARPQHDYTRQLLSSRLPEIPKEQGA